MVMKITSVIFKGMKKSSDSQSRKDVDAELSSQLIKATLDDVNQESQHWQQRARANIGCSQ